jgi:chemotaxis methyl-accepting protein methylase
MSADDERGEGFDSLLRHIKDERAFDFTGYKPASLARRVRRRMEVVGIDRYDEYLDHLQVHPDEFTHLFNTILINVTSFFRDPESWDYLREECCRRSATAGRADRSGSGAPGARPGRRPTRWPWPSRSASTSTTSGSG